MNLNFRKIFDANQTLFITGETGVGKSSLVRRLAREYKPDRKCIVVNMACLGEGVFESQMFGHKRGSFTGAHQDHLGFLDVAQNGVLFLDEVAELSAQSQKKLLEILEEKTFTPVGSTSIKRFEGMIILATHKNLASLVSEGSFRQDLYFRIHRFNYQLEPLRNKRDEIGKNLASKKHLFTDQVWDFLNHEYHWPGNFRELKNFSESLEFYSVAKITELSSLPLLDMSLPRVERKKSTFQHQTYSEAMSIFEKEFFENALEQAGGRVNFASRKLGISKTTLIAKLKKYGISSHMIKAMSQAG